MNVLSVISARSGSKGLPGKNIKILDGKPLIAHTIEASLKSKFVTKTIVSSDCENIMRIARQYGASTPYRRDENLATDDVPLIPSVIRDAAEQMKARGHNPDIILSLEPTYPFRNEQIIDKCIEKLLIEDFDWVVTVSKSREHPYRARTILQKGVLKPFFQDRDVFLQRQEFPDSFMLRGAVYATWVKNLYDNDFLNKKWGSVIIDDIAAIDIDEPFDFKIAKALINLEN